MICQPSLGSDRAKYSLISTGMVGIIYTFNATNERCLDYPAEAIVGLQVSPESLCDSLLY